VLAAALAIVGPRRTEPARAIARELIERFSAAGLKDALDESFMLDRLLEPGNGGASMLATLPDPRAQAMLDGLRARGTRSVFVRYLERLGGHPSADAVLAAITDHARLGAVDAQAGLAPDGGVPAGMDAAVRYADRRLGRRDAA
jgi:hypothetical protein